MTELSLPDPDTIRQRISTVRQEDYRHCLETAYLYAGRICEVVGTSTPGDNTRAIGPKGSEATLDTISHRKVVLFKVRTEKRDQMIRIIALPFRYEPLAEPLYQYFKSRKNDLVFPFTRQKIGAVARILFKGLRYPIEKYKLTLDSKLKLYKEVPKHSRPFNLHALRHLRATELVRFYHFGAEDLAAYCGWSLTTTTKGLSPTMARYIDLSWQQYIAKLFKQRGEPHA